MIIAIKHDRNEWIRKKQHETNNCNTCDGNR